LDETHSSYDREYAIALAILVSAQTVFREFRSRFIGKVSPVHFFLGSFDLAVTRFSGRRAPERPGADAVTKERTRTKYQPRLLARRTAKS